MTARAGRAWHRAWFRPEAAYNLAAARVLVAAQALWILLSRDLSGLHTAPAVFWRTIPDSLQWRYLLVPGHPLADRLLQGVAVVALAAALLGVGTRLACAVAALALYHLGPLEAALYTSAPIGRGLTIAPVALLVLAAAPCADALAPGTTAAGADARSRAHGWPLRLVRLLVIEIYLFSAIGKLERSGWDWGSAAHMQRWFWLFNQEPVSVVFGTLGPMIARSPWLCGAIGAATVVMEWAMPLALFSRRAARWLVPIALLFHVAVLLTLNIHVPEAWLVLVLVDWDALTRRWRRTPAPTPPASPAATPRRPVGG